MSHHLPQREGELAFNYLRGGEDLHLIEKPKKGKKHKKEPLEDKLKDPMRQQQKSLPRTKQNQSWANN